MKKHNRMMIILAVVCVAVLGVLAGVCYGLYRQSGASSDSAEMAEEGGAGGSHHAGGSGNSDTGVSSDDDDDADDEKTDTSVISLSMLTPDYDHAVQIFFSEDGIQADGDGIEISDTSVTISQAGTYIVSGSLDEGQLIVDATKNDDIILVLDGLTLSCAEDAPIFLKKADQVQIVLADETVNTLRSSTLENAAQSSQSTDEEDAKGGALYAKCNLSVNGTGTLQVYGYINNGIHTTKNLLIGEGTIEVKALHHAVKGKDSVEITGGSLDMTAGTDGVHSDAVVTVSGGNLEINADDDAVHADESLTVSGGDIVVSESYEGLEANQILLSGGTMQITASDDGINANGGSGSGFGFGGGGRFFGSSSSDSSSTQTAMPNLTITGGDIYVNAGGDGLDSNGNITVEGGTVIVDGPTSSANGAIDAGTENGGTCIINGGTVLAVGSSGMAETFGSSSAQCSFCYNFSSSYAAGDALTVTDAQGNVLMEHTMAKKGASVVFSAPALTQGETYTLTVGSQTADITLNSVSTSNGSSYGNIGGMGGGMGGGRQNITRPDSGDDGTMEIDPNDIDPNDFDWGDFDPNDFDWGDFDPNDFDWGDFDPDDFDWENIDPSDLPSGKQGTKQGR